MLIDEVQITLKAGHGGPGKVSFFPKKDAGPDGGNGGKGGDVYVTTTSDLTALNRFAGKKEFSAESGDGGGHNRKSGKNGEDLTLTMPFGSVLTDQVTGELFELNEIDNILLIAEGGLGGRGNAEFKSSRNTTPKYAQPGLPGQIRILAVVLKLIADFGLIGLPNAGKSSLLNELTAAHVKTADYPFTTVEPNLGSYQGKIIADIPGLIEGASAGKGLGIKFLKHIEKVKVLLHCLEAPSQDIMKDYKTVRSEMEHYSPELTQKEEIILLTKTDLVDEKILDSQLTKLRKIHKTILPISIYDLDSINKLSKMLLSR